MRVKESRYWFVWAVAVTLLTGCRYDGIVSEFQHEAGMADSAIINFGNGIIDNPLHTRAVTKLSQHSNSMGVWGWQTDIDGATAMLFKNQKVNYDSLISDWTYTPGKYWEKGSSYRFYAYAPHASNVPGTTVTINDSTGYITIDPVVLEGSNTMSKQAMPYPYGCFKDLTDTDWMIDRTGRAVPKEQIHSRVVFNMQHILSKFNIIVRTTSSVQKAGGSIILDSMNIALGVSAGRFTQKLSHSPRSEEPSIDSTEWLIDPSCPPCTLKSTQNVPVPDTGLYVVESLVIPHNTGESEVISIYYSVYSGDDKVAMHHTINLTEAIPTFYTAADHTLYINMGAEVITFTTQMSAWENVWKNPFL